MRVLRVPGREGWWLRQPIVQLCPCKLPFCTLSRLPLVVGWACTDVQSGEAPSGSKSSSDAPPPRDHADDHGEEGDDDDDDGDEVLNDFEVCVGVWSPISLQCWKPLSLVPGNSTLSVIWQHLSMLCLWRWEGGMGEGIWPGFQRVGPGELS